MPNLDDTLLRIYQGLLDSDGIHASLSVVARALGGHLAALHDEDLAHGTSRVMASGLPERELTQFIADYEVRWSGSNPLMDACLPALLREGVQHGDAVLGRQTFVQSDYYRELLKPLDIEHSLGMRVALVPQSRFAVATFNRSRHARQFDAASVQLARKLRPHLECAYMLHQRLGSALAECASLRAALEHAAVGLILVNADGRIRTMNSAAEQTLERLNAGHLSFSGQLELKDRHAKERWRRALASGDASVTDPDSHEIRILDMDPKSSITLAGALLRLHRLPLAAPAFAQPGIRWVATLTELGGPAGASDGLRSVLCSVLGLTPREADVALALREHGTAPAAAKALAVAPSTVRSHLKSIFGKLDLERQSQLIQRIEQIARV